MKSLKFQRFSLKTTLTNRKFKQSLKITIKLKLIVNRESPTLKINMGENKNQGCVKKICRSIEF